MAGTDLMYSDDGDYIDDGAGGFVETTVSQPACRHQLLDELGQWIGDPDAGRDRRGVKGRLNSERDAQIEADSVEIALEVLEEEGLIDDIEIAIDRDPKGRYVLGVNSRDTGSGATIGFDYLQSFGV